MNLNSIQPIHSNVFRLFPFFLPFAFRSFIFSIRFSISLRSQVGGIVQKHIHKISNLHIQMKIYPANEKRSILISFRGIPTYLCQINLTHETFKFAFTDE